MPKDHELPSHFLAAGATLLALLGIGLVIGFALGFACAKLGGLW